MRFIYSDSFVENVEKLSKEEKKLLKEKLALMFKNPSHPSLRTKKIHGQNEIFEASINMDIRMTWQYLKNNIILLRKVGRHDKTLKKP